MCCCCCVFIPNSVEFHFLFLFLFHSFCCEGFGTFNALLVGREILALFFFGETFFEKRFPKTFSFFIFFIGNVGFFASFRNKNNVKKM